MPSRLKAYAVATLAALGLAMAPPAAAAPDAVSCGETITTDTRLTADLHCPGPFGLILVGDVTLDLDGHTLAGPGPAPINNSIGVLYDPAASATISNGTLSGWNRAITAQQSVVVEPPADAVTSISRVKIRDAQIGIENNRANVAADRVELDSLGWIGVAAWGPSMTITNSTLRGTNIYAGTIGSVTVQRTEFLNESSIECSDGRIEVSRSTFEGGNIYFGLYCMHSRIADSTFTDNTRGAIFLSWGPLYDTIEPVEIVGNTFRNSAVAVSLAEPANVADNTFIGNETAITVVDPGMGEPLPQIWVLGNEFKKGTNGLVTDGPAQVGSNTARHLSGYDIYAPNATDLGHNRVSGPARDANCVGVICN